MVLVPDLATDLGQHNDDYTKWTFTIRDGVKFEDGSPVTAKNIAWGIQRCMDAATFPTGPCQYYSNVYFRGGSTYKGPYTAPNQKFNAVKVNGNKLTIFMDKPFPDMPYWGAFPANGPVPLGKASDPKTYKNHPLSTGPYMIKSFSQSKELVLERTRLGPEDRPGADAVPRRLRLQDPAAVGEDRPDPDGGLRVRADDADLRQPARARLPDDEGEGSDRLILGGQPCTFYWGPDNRKITDKRIREALSWAYPYKNAILAGGDIPGVTAVPATNLMPPGIPGRTAYNVTGREPFQTDPAKAKELLQQANAMGYDIKFLFRSDDPVSVKVKDAIVKALGQAGFKATPVPTTIANYIADRGKTTSDINVRSASWCSDWPSGSTWLPTVYANTDAEKTALVGRELLGVLQQGGRQEDQPDPADAARPAAEGLERPRQGGHDEVLPAVPDVLRRRGDGARVTGQGHERRQRAGHAHLEHDVGRVRMFRPRGAGAERPERDRSELAREVA